MWSGGQRRNITLAPVLLLFLLFLHSADAPCCLELFFFPSRFSLQEWRVHSSHTAGPVRGNAQSSPKVHQIRNSSVPALQCLLRGGIFRGALDTQGKENNREEQSFDFMSGGEMEGEVEGLLFINILEERKKHPPLTLSLDFTSDRVSLDN